MTTFAITLASCAGKLLKDAGWIELALPGRMRILAARLPMKEVKGRRCHMTMKGKVLALAVVSMLVAGGFAASSALQAADPSQETGPVYSLEGAWYGMTNIVGLPPTPTLDTFVSNAQRSGVDGSLLCNIPAGAGGGASSSGHGNWVRIATNTYAYTAVRSITSGTTHVGWFRFWGTITAVSDDELTGTFNAQSYQPNGVPISPLFTGTLERHRVDITFE